VRILVAEPLADDGLAILRRDADVDYAPGLPRAELLQRLAGCEALIVRSGVKVDAEVFAAAPSLVVVGRAGTGLDNIDLDAAERAGVSVVNAPDANTVAAAEHAIALMFALARHIPAAEASLRAGHWRRADFVGFELTGKTLGIAGLGRIGFALADRARGLQMAVIGSDPFVTAEVAAARGVTLLSLAEVLQRSDVVSIHTPLSAETRGLIGRAELAWLKPSAVLINAARGGIVDESALAEALADGRLAGAAIDVYSEEPLPDDAPLRTAPNTILTPHLGASTAEAQARAGIDTARAVLDVLAARAERATASTR
jgi:D-3-phosphoglycerate dehydrogenase / 2-oxoglutarate reductase